MHRENFVFKLYDIVQVRFVIVHILNRSWRVLLHQFVNNFDSPLELGLMFFSGLYLANTLATSTWGTIMPLNVFTTPCDARIESIDVLGTRRLFGWDGLQDTLEFVDKRFGMLIIGADLLGQGFLQTGLAAGSCI
jgi:hypothetical protein